MTVITLKSNVQNRLLAQTFILVLGISIVGLVGFAPSATLHAAAHDLRHSVAFPCH